MNFAKLCRNQKYLVRYRRQVVKPAFIGYFVELTTGDDGRAYYTFSKHQHPLNLDEGEVLRAQVDEVSSLTYVV